MPRIFTLFAFITLTTTNLHAYLDPGTGSLLLSSIVAIFASFIYFFKNLFYKIVSLSPKSLKSSLAQIGGGGNRPTLKHSNKNLCSFDNKDSAQDLKHSCDSHTKNPHSTTPLDSIVFYCEGRQYYNTFKPILDTLDCLKHPYTYLTSDEGDPALKRESNNFSIKEFIGVGNSAYTRLNFLKADICVLTTPSLQVLQIKRSRAIRHYCHIVHSLTPMTYRAFGVDYFDSVLVANEIQGNFVRQIEKVREVKRKYIAITGLTYLDELAKLRESIKDNNNKTTSAEVSLGDFVGCEATSEENKTNSLLTKRVANSRKSVKETTHKTILVSPSWGKETLLSKYGLRLLEPLAKSPYHIIIRPHPQSLVGEIESNNIKHLQNALKDYNNVEWDIGTPNVIAFQKADLMISDFSSVIFDFVCLEDKPVLTLDFSFDSAGYDLADIYDENNIDEFWTFKALNQIGGKISEGDFPRIQNIIDSALQSNANKDALAKIKNALWCYPHDSGTQATLEILKIQRYLLESQLDKNLLNRLDLTKNAIKSLKNAKDSTLHKGFNND